VLAVGASTGGPQALFAFVQRLGSRFPLPVLLTQHMPRAFTPILAQHLDRLGTLRCAEAVEGEAVQPGRLYVAPGDRHLTVAGEQGRVLVRLSDGPPENFCRPAVDPMLRSAVASYEGRVLVAILTGMGSDGLRGAEAVVAAGGTVVAQDEASAVVWGMPGAVAQAGLCSAVAPVPALVQEVIRLVTGAQA